jgi:chemotaxis protein methyltransferase CheR
MSFNADSLGLSKNAVWLLRDLVHDRTGLYYENGRCDLLADRLSGLVTQAGFHTFLDYYYFLKYDAHNSGEDWGRVMDALSVPETYFWREIDQLQAIASHIVPAIVRDAPRRTVTIWCVPCATGEEPLTLAMLLDREGWFQRVDIALHASDASPAVLERARQGRYRERAFRSLPVDLRDRYFERRGDTWQVDPRLYARVRTWSVVNLKDADQVGLRAVADIIVCRNVFIYFSPAAVREVVDRFADRMPVPGYLCVGATESLLRVTDRFMLEEIGGAFVYVKRRDSREGSQP